MLGPGECSAYESSTCDRFIVIRIVIIIHIIVIVSVKLINIIVIMTIVIIFLIDVTPSLSYIVCNNRGNNKGLTLSLLSGRLLLISPGT